MQTIIATGEPHFTICSTLFHTDTHKVEVLYVLYACEQTHTGRMLRYKHGPDSWEINAVIDRWFHLVSEQSSDTAAEQNINPAQTHYICRISNVLIHNTSVYHILCIHLLEHFLEYVLLTDG